MSVRRNTSNRLALIRTCHTCGKVFPTTAASPFMRMVQNEEGKYNKTAYFCSESCKKASYKYNMDGLEWKRRKEREQNRDKTKRAEYWKKYYEENGDRIRANRVARYRKNREDELLSNEFYRRKRRLLEVEQKVLAEA